MANTSASADRFQSTLNNSRGSSLAEPAPFDDDLTATLQPLLSHHHQHRCHQKQQMLEVKGQSLRQATRTLWPVCCPSLTSQFPPTLHMLDEYHTQLWTHFVSSLMAADFMGVTTANTSTHHQQSFDQCSAVPQLPWIFGRQYTVGSQPLTFSGVSVDGASSSECKTRPRRSLVNWLIDSTTFSSTITTSVSAFDAGGRLPQKVRENHRCYTDNVGGVDQRRGVSSCESTSRTDASCLWCRLCFKRYSTQGAMKMHTRTHTLPSRCPVCDKAFSRPWLLQGHLRTHTGERPFICSLCQRAFSDRSNLRAHVQTHAAVKKYACSNCDKSFSRMSLLTKHMDTACPRRAPRS